MLNGFKKWVMASRALYTSTIILPSIAGGVIAWNEGSFSWLPFIITLIALFFANIATNLTNDYFDYKSGVDAIDKGRQYKLGAEVFLKSGLTPKNVIQAVAISMGIVVVLGVYLALTIDMRIFYFGIVGIFLAFFYTAPPIKLGYRGFSEIACWVGNGLLAVCGTEFVLTGRVSNTALLASVPIGLLVTAIIYIGNVCDAEADARVGKKTLSVRLGRKAVIILGPAFYGAIYLSIILGIVAGVLPKWTLLSMLTIPLAINILRLTSRYYNDIPHYAPSILMTVRVFMLSTVLMIVGFAIAHVI